MKAALLLLALALPAVAVEFGGHEDPKTESAGPVSADKRRATLEELWQRRLLPPDQNSWSPQDDELLRKIRAAERDALKYLERHGGVQPWTAKARASASPGVARLTKEGYDHYLFLLSQDAVVYFEAKGADAKWAFKLLDWDGKPLFDGGGLITDEGVLVYHRALLNLETYWQSPNGDVFGTRRPPTKKS